MLARVDVRFRELAPTAPVRLDPDDPTHETTIKQWHLAGWATDFRTHDTWGRVSMTGE